LWLVAEEPGLADVIAEQRELLSRLRAVVEAKDAENQVLRAELGAATRIRRPSAAAAGPGWAARRRPGRGGRRSWTCRSPGR
jgi:hypothetical protein